MDFKGEQINCESGNGTITSLISTDNGIILTPNPIVDGSGSIGLVANLKYNTITKSLSLGKNNSNGDDTAFHNLSIGSSAGAGITTGDNNIFLGFNAGLLNTTGSSNVYIGVNAGNNNITQSYNIAVGDNTLTNNLSKSNIAIGHKAGEQGIINDSLIAIGSEALRIIDNGGANTAIGNSCLKDLTQGTNNTVICSSGTDRITDGNNNTIVGQHNMILNTSTFDNCIIGYNNVNANITMPVNTLVVGNNNFNDSTIPHTDLIVLGSRNINNLNGYDFDIYKCILIGNDHTIDEKTKPNTTRLSGEYISMGVSMPSPWYNVEQKGIIALQSKVTTNVAIPTDNYRGLKNLSWNWSAPITFYGVGIGAPIFNIDLESISWDDDAVQNSPDKKSVFISINFICNATNYIGTVVASFSGSVAVMVFENSGGWFLSNVSPVQLLNPCQFFAFGPLLGGINASIESNLLSILISFTDLGGMQIGTVSSNVNCVISNCVNLV